MANRVGSAKRLPEASVLTVPPFESSPFDIKFENHGSIFLIRGISVAGQAWLDENVGDDETLFFGNAVVAEPRYVAAIAQGALDAGLVVG
jgi:hypothetical protein